MTLRISIPKEESNFVQEKFYKYNSLLAVLAYLNDNCNSKEFIEQKLEQATENYIELEKAKNTCGKKYIPDGYKVLKYTFDFDNSQILYEAE